MRSPAKATSAIAAISGCIVVLCLCASPALAAKGVVGFFGGTGVEGGQFATTGSGPGGVAVNQTGVGGVSAGDFYVVDRGNRRIQEFHADGAFVRAWGWGVATGAAAFEICTEAASCKAGTSSAAAGAFNSPQGIAIEQATGNVYVTDQFNKRVAVYSATGTFEGAFGWKVKVTGAEGKLQFCTTATGCQAGEGATGKPNAGAFGTGIGFPTVAPAGSAAAGHLFVPNKTNRRVDEFAPELSGSEVTGITYVKGFGWNVNAAVPAEEFQTCTAVTECKAPGPAGTGAGQFASGSPGAVAVDSSGRVYAVDNGNSRVQAFSSTPTPQGAFAATFLSSSPTATDLLIDTANDHLLVAKNLSSEQRVLELDSTGKLLTTFEKGGAMPATTGIGAVSGGGDIYLATVAGLEEKPGIWHLSSTLVPPAVTIEPVVTFTGTTATFEGHVSTDAIGAKYHFEYSADGASWTKTSEGSVPANSSQLVSKSAEGLEAHTEYQVRLVADKAYAGGSASAQTSFTTGAAAPQILSVSHSHVRDTTALLETIVNPENEDTEFQFEYTDEATYEAEGFGSAISVPAPPGHVSGGAPRAISQQLAGLEPGGTYVYRLLISNETGDDESAVGSFTTYATSQAFESCANDVFRVNRPSQILPDCRAYEQATPIDKNAGNVQSEYSATKASPTGDRVSFFAIGGLPGGEGAQASPTYLATRAGGDWSTQGLLPAASAGESARVIGWTPDFNQVFSTLGRLGVGPGLVSRSSEGGALSTVAPFSPQGSSGVEYIGASEGGSVAFFQSVGQWPVAPESHAPAPGLVQENASLGTDHENLYAWDRDSGDLYFAGVLPDGSTAVKGAHAGHVGSTAYRIDSHAVAEDGSVYFTDQRTGQLYHRFNPAAPETTNKDKHGDCIPDPALACTVHISASEKYDGKGLEKHDAAGPQATQFMAASTDGAKAIFTSSEKLTTDAYTGPEPEPAAIARANSADGLGKSLNWLPTTADEVDIDPVAGYVYWTDPANERIGRAKLDQSAIEPNLITGLVNLRGLTVVDEPGNEYLFWTTPAPGEDTENGSNTSEFKVSGEGTIGRAELNGENPEPDCLEGITNPFHIDANSEHIYWTVPGRRGSVSGEEKQFGTGGVGSAGLDCNEGSVVPELVEKGDRASGDIVVDEAHLYFSSFVAISLISFVTRFNLDGTERNGLEVNVPETSRAAGLALDGSHLYWTDYLHSKIGRAALDGSDLETDFITEVNHPQDLADDSQRLYWSAGQQQVSNNGNDIYFYDSKAPAGHRLIDLAPEHDGVDGIQVQGVLGTSADASYVYIVANGVPDGPIDNSPNARNEEAQQGNCNGTGFGASGSCNLYLAHDRQITFVARLDASGLNDNFESTSDSANWASTNAQLPKVVTEKTARVSPDGQTLLFRSQRQLTAYDNEGPECVRSPANGEYLPGPCLELYLYRAGEPGLTCVSCNPTGAAPAGFASLVRITAGGAAGGGGIARPQFARNLSADGKRVFFETRDQLVAEDTNGDESCELDVSYQLPIPSCQDAYMWEAAGKGSCPESAAEQGCIYLLSTGKSPHPSFFGDASLSGNDAFIFTFSKLVRQDEDDLLDVYDASVGGGLTAQDELPSVPCEGEACKDPAGPAPQSSSAGSQSFSGSANPKPAHRKAKKHRHKKRRHAKRHHRANANGRASR